MPYKAKDDFKSKVSCIPIITPAVIVKTAEHFQLGVLEKDLRKSLAFLSKFQKLYPIDKTTSEQFSMLMVFFAIRYHQDIPIAEQNRATDLELMPHFKLIHQQLKMAHRLTAAQTDFWQWFSRTVK